MMHRFRCAASDVSSKVNSGCVGAGSGDEMICFIMAVRLSGHGTASCNGVLTGGMVYGEVRAICSAPMFGSGCVGFVWMN